MKVQLSFKTKLQLILVTVSLTAVTLLAVVAHQSSMAFLEGKELQLRTATDGLMDKIDRNLFERYGDVQAYALSEPARSGNADRITEFMNDMMTTYSPIYDLMIVTDVHGKVIAVPTKNKLGEPMKSDFLLGTDYSRTAWFKKAISGTVKPGSSIFGELSIDDDVIKVAGTSGRVMNFSAPIYDKQTGNIVGVWSNRMSWNDVVQAIATEESEKIKGAQISTAIPYIVNNQGVYLLHPQGEEFELKKSLAKKLTENDKNIKEAKLDTPYFSGDILESTIKSKGYSTYPGAGWSAVLQIPASDPQTESNKKFIIFAFSLIILANVFAFWLIRGMGSSFVSVVGQMSHESTQLRTSANHISKASQQLSETTTEQAAAIEETAASMEEIVAMLAQTTQNAANCKSLSIEGQYEVIRGKEVTIKMSSAMEEIAASNAKLDHLVGLIENIKDKTKIINDIVSETRLLSFNASIEAARAGTHGKGFAVVAEEVGKLAAISGKAADEIRDLLDSSRQEVSQVVKDTQERVHLGKNISMECELAFSTMGKSFEKVNDLIHTIANASREQELGINQTNKAMAEMDKVTHSNSKGAEVLAEQAEKLYVGAETLNTSIEKIRSIILGTSTESSPPTSGSPSVNQPDINKMDTPLPVKAVTRSDNRWKGVA